MNVWAQRRQSERAGPGAFTSHDAPLLAWSPSSPGALREWRLPLG